MNKIKQIFFPSRVGRIGYQAVHAMLFMLFACVMFLSGLSPKSYHDVAGIILADQLLLDHFQTLALIPRVLLIAVFLSYLYAGIYIMVSRLHDINFRGWWALFLLLPLINVIFLLTLVFYPGTKGANRFGEQPAPSSKSFYALAFIYIIFAIIAFSSKVALMMDKMN